MMTPDLWFFRRLALHQRLPRQVLDTLQREGRVERWGHAASIFHDLEDDQVYTILSGQVFLRDRPGSLVPIKLSRGDIFGALLDEHTLPNGELFHNADLLNAYDAVTLVSCPRERFDALCAPHLGESSVKIQRMVRRPVSVHVPLQGLLYTPPLVRLSKALLYLAETQRGQELGGGKLELALPLRAKPLASLLGLDASSLTVPLRFLQQSRVIVPQTRSILIPDLEPLRRAAQGRSTP